MELGHKVPHCRCHIVAGISLSPAIPLPIRRPSRDDHQYDRSQADSWTRLVASTFGGTSDYCSPRRCVASAQDNMAR